MLYFDSSNKNEYDIEHFFAYTEKEMSFCQNFSLLQHRKY